MKTHNTTYRFAAGVAVAAALILVWLSLGVGIIGADGDPANLMYFGVLAVEVIGVAVSPCRAWANRIGRGLTGARRPTARIGEFASTERQRRSCPSLPPGRGAAIALAGEAQAAGATLTTTQDTSKKLKLHTLISILTIVSGVVVMMAKMYADSEPGAIPILLVVFGIGWYFITRVRIQMSGAS